MIAKEIRSRAQSNILQLLLLVIGPGRGLVIRVLGDGVLGGALDLGEELLRVLGVALEQVVGDHALRGLAEPLEEGEVAELVGAEDLEHLDGLVADVLDKVAHVARDDADVTGDVVEGAGGALGGEDGDARATPDEEVPLVRVGVPVHLAQGAGLDDGVGGGHGLGDGEVLGVGDAHLTTRGDDWLLGEHLVGEVVLGLLDVLAGGPLVIDGARVGALEDVFLALGQVGEDLWGEVEVLGNDRLGRVGWRVQKSAGGQANKRLVNGPELTEPVSQDESALLREATIVEYKQELCAIGAQALQAVGYAAREVPQVTLLEVLHEVAALVVERGDTHRAVKDISPLCLLVPMQLADDALAQAHVDRG